MYSKVIQLYIYPFFFRFFSIQVIQRIQVEFLLLHSRSSLVSCFIYSGIYMSTLISKFIPSSTLLTGFHKFFFLTSAIIFLFCKEVCFYPHFRFHIYAIAYDIYLSLTWLCVTDSRSIHIFTNDLNNPFLFMVQ